MTDPMVVIKIAFKHVFADECPSTLTIAQGAAKKALLKLGKDAYIVFHEYLLEAKNEWDSNFTDEYIAAELGWPIATITRARLKLTKAGWFKETLMKPIGRGKNKVRDINMIDLGKRSHPELALTTFRINSTKFYDDLTEEEQEAEDDDYDAEDDSSE